MSKLLDVCLCFYVLFLTWGTGGSDKSSHHINLYVEMYMMANHDKLFYRKVWIVLAVDVCIIFYDKIGHGKGTLASAFVANIDT